MMMTIAINQGLLSLARARSHRAKCIPSGLSRRNNTTSPLREHGGGEEEEQQFIRIVHARGAIPNEVGPARCRATQQEEEEEEEEERHEEERMWNLQRARRFLMSRGR